jgi:uridine kinase
MATELELARLISDLSENTERLVVGVSGFGGSGKSTVARRLVSRIANSARLRGDDFLDPTRSHQRSDDWDGVDRTRLANEVLIPFHEAREARFRRYDWAAGGLGDEEVLAPCRVLIVDAVGLFHPQCAAFIDLKVWVDVELELATAQGKTRDRALGRDHDRLWDDIWVPNERAFAENFAPRSSADVLVEPERVTPSTPPSP